MLRQLIVHDHSEHHQCYNGAENNCLIVDNCLGI